MLSVREGSMANLYVKTAVEIAKSQIQELFEDEGIVNVGLEEVVHDPDAKRWKITIGFARSWEQDAPLVNQLFKSRSPRTYKMVMIDDDTSQIVAVTDRALPETIS